MEAGIIGLIGVVIGGGISFGASWFLHQRGQKQGQARAYAMALAYVDGVLEMDERRQHGELLHRPVLEALKAGDWSVGMPKIFGAEIYPNPNEVQKAVIGQLGHLKPNDAKDMVMFLNMGDGLDADDAAMSTGKMDNLMPQQRIAILEGYLKLKEEMVDRGRALVRRLESKKG